MLLPAADDPLGWAARVAQAVHELATAAPEAIALGELFAAAGHELALVGGPVRDALLGLPSVDLDLTTDAHPERVLELVRPWADAVWDVGIRFGTVGLRKGDVRLEITTYRAESYDPDSRKPEVSYGQSLDEDLLRRDFAVNAMAVRLPSLAFVDRHSGLADLAARVLQTPGSPRTSFTDDPLRMMRAARFVSQLGFTPAQPVIIAMTELAARIEIVSAERVRDELSKLLLGDRPRAGLALLVDTGLAAYVLPELPALALEIDEHHRHKDVYQHSLTVLEQAIDLETTHDPASGPDLVLRLAALLHDVGKPKTRRFEAGGRVSFHHHEAVGARMARKRLTALRYPGEVIDAVSLLTELHLRFHGYGEGDWTDSAVRRYVRDAGDQLTRLHKLTRADCTTRNRRKAEVLARTYDTLEERIDRLSEEEDLKKIRPDLDGNAIMAILGVPPGREVGEAYKYLLDLRMDQGPLAPAEAESALRAWWAARTSP